MDIRSVKDVIQLVLTGIAISSMWYWIFSLMIKTISVDYLIKWVLIFIPQGIIIAWFLTRRGII